MAHTARSLLLLAALALAFAAPALAQSPPWTVVVHGGAGSLTPGTFDAEDEAGMRDDIARALELASDILERGGSSLDAVTAAVRHLEDSPHFNAGRGAVFTADARHEFDASIMVGDTRAAGAIAGVSGVRHPILAARAVMERSPHVMFAGPGAEDFAREQGLEFMPDEWFHTERRRRALDAAREQAREDNSGTVGAVAIDRSGVLAAATSTGGMTNKQPGRIGDSPVIGAGTWADGQCAVSATGWGEYYIRAAAAHDICARARYQGISVDEAATRVVMEEIPALGGDGGVIALDAEGRVSMPFDTEGMARGYAREGEGARVLLYADEHEE